MSAEESAPGIPPRLVWVMAVATGVAVSNNYYAQPLLAVIAGDLHLSHGVAGLIVTVAQAGYAAGLIFILPLGDLVERRGLVALMSLGTAAALVWLGLSGSVGSLLFAALTVGAFTVLGQVLIPFAASLASDAERGRVVGTVMSGLLVGILLARTAAGYLAAAFGWREVYFIAAGLMVGIAALLRLSLPRYPAAGRQSYPALLRSVLALVREEPILRRRAVYGALSFGAFSVLWTSLAFLLAGPAYRYDTGTIGLFGLAGAAGALAASAAGRLADKGHVHATTGACALLLALSWFPLWLGGHSLAALLIGVVVLDIGAQGLHISNQSEIYRLRPEARSRLNSAYMTTYFAGGALGSTGSAFAFSAWGWKGVSAVGAAFGILAGVLWLAERTARAEPGSVRAG